jgi:uncharacterized protein
MRWLALFLILFTSSCGGSRSANPDVLNTTVVRLPDGGEITAEVVTAAEDMMRGLMFRDSLAPDRGMLFAYAKAGTYQFWMYQVRIPLDMIWMDRNHRIVEIAANVPPCTTSASQCAQYGGHAEAQYILELAGGVAAKHGLRVGDTLAF